MPENLERIRSPIRSQHREVETALQEDLQRESLLERFGLPVDRLIVLSIGNIIERKGWRVLLEAVAILDREKETDLFFVWFGDGDERAEMLSTIAELNLQNSVKIVGKRETGETRAELLEFFRLADIFVHPSFAEGLPGAMLEAGIGNTGRRFASQCDPECVIDGETVCWSKRKCKGFCRSNKNLANDQDLRAHSEKGRARVLENFTEERGAANNDRFLRTFYSSEIDERQAEKRTRFI